MCQPMTDSQKSVSNTTSPADPFCLEMRLRFMCEQLRDWGGLPDDEIQRIYEAEMKRLVNNPPPAG